MLRTSVLDKPCRSLDRRNSSLHRQYELFELGEEMRRPSVGRVNDCSCSYDTSVGVDSNPAIAVALRCADHGRVRL
jgi:hypothetical protein